MIDKDKVTQEDKDEQLQASDKHPQDTIEEKPVDAAEQEEHNHEEHARDPHGDDHEDIDYSHSSKKDLLEAIATLSQETNFRKIDRHLKALRAAMDDIKHAEQEGALQKFVADGGDAMDFDFKEGETMVSFEKHYKVIKEKRSKHYQELEKHKEHNLNAKNTILEKLRNLVDSEESATSIEALKALQKEWKAIGPVPGAQVKSLWANYNALMDRFYDNRSIHFELKELDRKKNLEAKIELCDRAEQLLKVENIKDAIKELNDLHEEFKHIGPVPKADQEALWQRFKAASDQLYDRRRTYIDQLKKDLSGNAEKKKELADKVQPYAQYDSENISDWNAKTKELISLQKDWEKIGGLPRDEARDINKMFWKAFKAFFSNKNAFFKRLEGRREENLKLKLELVEKAEAIKDSTDWNNAAKALKQLQVAWKEIGPVPEKQRNEVYKKFKAACDHFFQKKRTQGAHIEDEYKANLKAKKTICAAIENIGIQDKDPESTLYDLLDQWDTIGFVPKESIKPIQNQLLEALDKYAEQIQLSEEEKTELKLTVQLHKIKSGPNADRRIQQKENGIRKQISQLENDIVLWKNNLEFFAQSRTADKLNKEFDEKIAHAQEEIGNLKQQLKIVRNI